MDAHGERAVGSGTCALTPQQIDRTLDALADAARTFRPTLAEQRMYRVWLAILWTAALSLPVVVAGTALGYWWSGALVIMVAGMLSLLVSGLATLLLLPLNAPLIFRIYRQHEILRRAGLADTAHAIWAMHRTRPEWRRFDRVFLAAIALGYGFFGWVAWQRLAALQDWWRVGLALLLVCIAHTIALALLVERKRDELEIAASADQARTALAGFAEKQRGDGIPIALLETAARIEGARIARDRARAVVASTNQPRRYAVIFGQEAANATAALSLADRLVLQDFLDGVTVDPGRPGIMREPRHVRIAGGAVDVEYFIEPKRRVITVAAVSRASSSGPAPGRAEAD